MTTGKDPHSLPPCQFVPHYCSEGLLKTIGNGEAKFTPGRMIQTGKEKKVSAHSANIDCNDDGFYMSVHGKIWRGPKQVMIEKCSGRIYEIFRHEIQIIRN